MVALTKVKIATGSLLLVAGFIIYQLGIFMVEQPRNLLGEEANAIFAYLAPGQTVELSSVMMKFIGGIVAILGLIVAMTGLSASQVNPDDIQILKSSVRALESSVQALHASTGSAQRVIQQSVCKFCGVKMAVSEIFCPACGKAQG
ncbi:hypothetical protein MUP59_02140 [Candidatus Bathyarchaeota archaeon]|nr:hypothetical protein [Candidatus Bathyarchaeota archaeon]